MTTVPNQISRSQWIFGFKTDLILFSGTLLISYLIVLLFYILGFDFDVLAPIWLIPILHVISDGSHIFSTFYRIRHDNQNQKIKYFLLFLFVIALNSLIFKFDPNLYTHYLAYFAVYHFARQQYGWFMISARKCQTSHTFNTTWDKIIIYNATLVPVLIWMCKPSEVFGWFNVGDLVDLKSPHLIQYITIFHFILFALYFMREFKIYKITKSLPLSKYHILAVTWLIWYPTMAYFQKQIIGLVLFALSHGIQYMYVTFEYEKVHTQNKQISRKALFTVLYLLIVFIAIFEVFYNKKFETYTEQKMLPYWLIVIGTGFINSFQITHYILDGFLWKPSQDKNISSFFRVTQ